MRHSFNVIISDLIVSSQLEHTMFASNLAMDAQEQAKMSIKYDTEFNPHNVQGLYKITKIY